MKTVTDKLVHTVVFNEFFETLSPGDVARYRQDGVILVRGLFPRGNDAPIVRDLAERLALLEALHGLSPGGAADDIREISRRVIALEETAPETQSILYDSMNTAPSLHRFASDPKLLEVIQSLLSPIVSIHERYLVLMSLPAREWHLAAWHQDWYYNEGPASTLTLYAPLQPTDERNGSLQFAIEAHQQGIFEHGEHDHGIRSKWHSIPPESVEEFDRVVSTRLDVGDVLLFNSLVPHTPRINRSEHVRFVINLRYRDQRDPDFLKAGWRTGPIQSAREAMNRKAERVS